MKRGGEGEKIVRKKETNEERQHGGEGGGGGGGGGGTKGTGGGLEQQSCQKHQSHARPAILFLTHGQICDSIFKNLSLTRKSLSMSKKPV